VLGERLERVVHRQTDPPPTNKRDRHRACANPRRGCTVLAMKRRIDLTSLRVQRRPRSQEVLRTRTRPYAIVPVVPAPTPARSFQRINPSLSAAAPAHVETGSGGSARQEHHLPVAAHPPPRISPNSNPTRATIKAVGPCSRAWQNSSPSAQLRGTHAAPPRPPPRAEPLPLAVAYPRLRLTSTVSPGRSLGSSP